MKTVLLIDDDAVVRTVLGGFLKKNGWQVWEAAEGEAGLTLARAHSPNAILCDLLLPGLNGFQLCAALRQDPALSHTCIIAISSKKYPGDRQIALDAGADEFLSKPVNPQDLLRALERRVETMAPSAAPAVAVAPTPGPPVTVKFWGVRGSIPTPGPATVQFGGNTSCIEVRAGDEIIILDSGSGIRPLGLALAAEFQGRPLHATILITHTHWDHIQGFPFFKPAYDPQNRIRILGFEGARAGLAGIFANQMEGRYFPVGLKELPGHIVIEELKEMNFNVGTVKVQAAFANHPGICVGYRLETGSGSLVYLPDNEPFYHQFHQPDTALLAEPEALEFARAEDANLVRFIQGADLLIIDTQYNADEYLAHEGWGHGCVDDVVALAVRAQVKRLFLFHHDPAHDDAAITAMAEQARALVAAQGASLGVEAAREGQSVKLPGN